MQDLRIVGVLSVVYVKYIDLKFFDEYKYDKYESPITPTGKEWMHQVLYYDQYEIPIADGLHMHQVLCYNKYKEIQSRRRVRHQDLSQAT